MNIYDRFEKNARNFPNKPAFIYFDKNDWQTLTYGDILDQTNRFFLGLSACSLTPNMSAALMTPPSVEFFPFALALIRFGITPIILDPAIGLKKVGECLAESKPDIFIGNTLTHALRVIFGWGRDSVKHNITIQYVKGRKSKAAHLIPNPSSLIPNSPAAVIYTSGSTGLPKGAIYTQSNLAAQLDLLQSTFNITQDEVDLPAFPVYALIDLLLGVTSVIPDVTFPAPGKTDPEKVIRAIQRFGVTNMFASPVVLEILSSFAENNHSSSHPILLPSLKRIITAGAPATIALQQKFRRLLEDHTDLFGIYGATETLPIAKVESREIFSLKGKTEQGAGICLGKPIDGVTVRIIEISDSAIQQWQDSLTVQSNVVGEITVQSAATTREYLNRAESNRLSKIFRHTCTGVQRKCCEEDALPDEAISDPERGIASGYRPRNDEMDVIHRMGDVGYFDDEGRLWYYGRKSHRVIVRGDVLFTEQIENIFNAHPQVYRTALVGVDDKPVLWVELEKGVNANKEKVIEELKALAKNHPQAARIQTFLFIKKFPTDVRHNSKIIREKLRELANLKT